jgi:hypothetical protein
MTTSPLTLTNSTGAVLELVSAHVLHFEQGAWSVDVEFDPAALAANGLPSGAVTLSVGGQTMRGTVDPRSSGTFGQTGRARVVAGAGAWDKSVASQDFTNDGGITSTTVYQQTALAIGEQVVDLAPTLLGVKWERTAGPASRVFRDAPWWVDLSGVTQVGAPRAVSTPPDSLVIHEWDPTRQRITFSCESLLLPSTLLNDARFNGSNPTIYDVEQRFDAHGSIGWAWSTSSACSQIVADLKAATLEWTRAAYRTLYRYRFIQFSGGSRFALQAVNPAVGVPDLIPLSPWSGLSGLSTTPAPSQEVLVGFENADPGLPRIVSYSLDGMPISSTLDASATVKIGPSAASVQLAGGAGTLAKGAWATALQTALLTFATGLNVSTLSAQASALAAALANPLVIPPSNTTKTTAT